MEAVNSMFFFGGGGRLGVSSRVSGLRFLHKFVYQLFTICLCSRVLIGFFHSDREVKQTSMMAVSIDVPTVLLGP